VAKAARREEAGRSRRHAADSGYSKEESRRSAAAGMLKIVLTIISVAVFLFQTV
jgi:hypothetical protein